MKKLETVLKNIENSVDFKKANKGNLYYSAQDFLDDAKSYIKAVKERRMLISIESVSQSGMTRHFKVVACIKSGKQYGYRNYLTFLNHTGNQVNKNKWTVVVTGCGMDMMFWLNYTTIHHLHSLGIISKKECDRLSQQTPTYI